MNRLEINHIRGVRTLLAVLVCLVGGWTPTAAFGQPGRTFTPPPPPPQIHNFTPPRTPTFTPPPVINHQQNIQHSQQSAARHMEQFRMSNHRDMLKTQQDFAAMQRMTNPIRGSTTPAGGAANRANVANIGNLARVEIIVVNVEPNSQCADLGFMKGDVLVSYAGRDLKSIEHLRDLTKLHRDDGLQALVVLRDGQLLRFDVAPGPLGLKMRMLKNGVG